MEMSALKGGVNLFMVGAAVLWQTSHALKPKSEEERTPRKLLSVERTRSPRSFGGELS